MSQPHPSPNGFVVGVDVGTSSARAGVIRTADGRIVASHSHPIRIFHPQPNYYQHSSADIWQSVCIAIRTALQKAAAALPSFTAASVVGIAFDATCSLVVLGEDDVALSVSPDGEAEQNVIVWMDHRAEAEAREINSSAHEVLRYVGGRMSVEMELPKLLWLKRRMPATYRTAARFMDLADFLSYKATGRDGQQQPHHSPLSSCRQRLQPLRCQRSTSADVLLSVRSLCTVTCKWGFLAHEQHSTDGRNGQPAAAAASSLPPSDFQHGWSDSFFTRIGLEEMVRERYRRLGEGFFCQHIGSAIGDGLTAAAAAETGLRKGAVVGVGIIDAHAGGIAMIGGSTREERAEQLQADGSSSSESLSGRLAIICGTSSCHMAVTDQPAFVPGVWGPYFSAMVPGMWLLEGGQSATGSLLDHVIDSHALGAQLRQQAAEQKVAASSIIHVLLQQLQQQQSLSSFHLLTHSLHVLPYHHGNRSPRADSSLLGACSGLTLTNSLQSLSLLYLATLQAVAYGTRHILDTVAASSSPISRVYLCGGLSRSALFTQTLADVLGMQVRLKAGGAGGEDSDAMLLGSGMIAASACGEWGSLREAMRGMAGDERTVDGASRDSEIGRYHDRKYRVFLSMYEHQMQYRQQMQG